MANLTNQRFVVARLVDYSEYSVCPEGEELISYLWRKLEDIEEPMYILKQEILNDSVRGFFAVLQSKAVTDSDLTDFKYTLERSLSRGDYADAAFHLVPEVLNDPKRRPTAKNFLSGLKAYRALDEEKKPQASRPSSWEKLVSETADRIGLTELERVRTHRPLTSRRLRFILRRLRLSSYEYCAAFHLPTSPQDTLSPFMMSHLEALVAANRRFLHKLRDR